MGKSHPAGGCDYCDSVFLLLAYADFGQLHGIDHEGWGNRADEPALRTMQEKYETGDIVMFHYYDADGGKTVVKRIIATEGDHIRILADGGVEVNGAKIAGGICPRQNGRSGGYDCAEGNGICDGG